MNSFFFSFQKVVTQLGHCVSDAQVFLGSDNDGNVRLQHLWQLKILKKKGFSLIWEMYAEQKSWLAIEMCLRDEIDHKVKVDGWCNHANGSALKQINISRFKS